MTMKKKRTEKNSFFKKYRWVIAIAVLAFVAVFFAIFYLFRGYVSFRSDSVPEKSNWLVFLGSYLSFTGTISVSIIATLQSRFYSEQNEKKEKRRRAEAIQPLFSVKIESINSSLVGYTKSNNIYKSESISNHQNVTISIENVGAYPISHVIIFDRYLYQLLKCNEKKEIQCAYEDSPDYSSKSKQLIRISQSDYQRNEKGLPERFNINYDDVDGNAMCQTFVLRNFDGVDYYSLQKENGV